MMDRKQFMAQVNFIRPVRAKTKADVSVNITNGKKKKMAIYFRNGVNNFFGERVKVGIYKDRMIIEDADFGDGFKLSKNKGMSGETKDNFAFFHVTYQEWMDEWVGEYDLKIDDFYDYYYLSKKDVRLNA